MPIAIGTKKQARPLMLRMPRQRAGERSILVIDLRFEWLQLQGLVMGVCKRRFLELEQEGVNPDLDALLSVVLVQEERQKRDRGEALQIDQDAAQQGVSLIEHLSGLRRLDFQDFTRCKRLYNKAYHIKFGEDLNLSSQLLEEVQRFIKARHRIVHVTPLSPMIFEPGKMDDEAMDARVERATRAFDTFINELHAATLRLRPVK